MKSMLALPIIASVPLAAAGISPLDSSFHSVSKKYGHKFTISLNVYSFNTPFREGIIDLFDVLDYFAA